MNERIRELAEQADLHATLYFRKEQLRKFAGLIVQECVGIADEYDGVGSTIVSRIEKHFGVE